MKTATQAFDFLNSPAVPLSGRDCTQCPAFSDSGECLAFSCDDLDDELENLAILSAQARGEIVGWN